jgi:regulator of RNase E activity RraA
MSTFTDDVRVSEATPKLILSPTSGNPIDQLPGTDALVISAVANSAAADTVTLTNAAFGQATTITLPDPGVSATNLVYSSQVGNVTTVSITPTNSAIIAAYTTPVQLIAAPGAGKVILIQEASYILLVQVILHSLQVQHLSFNMIVQYMAVVQQQQGVV